MKLTVISDIHGNIEAFKAVLADIDRLGLETLVCLGDNIGYGPDPDEVVALLRSRNIPSLLGNHELGLVDPTTLSWFNPLARRSLLQTKLYLTPEIRAYLKSLPVNMTINECLLVHGCPPDSVNTYLFEPSPTQFVQIFEKMTCNLCMVGHTHELALISYTDGQIVKAPLREGAQTLAEDSQYIINVGSVGQPRDGNNNAKYVIWDSESRILEVRFVPYNIRKTADKIIALGLPRSNAERLW
jgi:predicted phosphodiesterase